MGVNVSHLRERYPTPATLGFSKDPLTYAYGAITLYGAAFQRTSASLMGPKRRNRNTTSPLPYERGFSLPSAAFPRRYSRHRSCFLFLRVLRCFSSPRSRSLRSNSEIPGSKAACAYPGLIAACHVLHRLPSPTIHCMA